VSIKQDRRALADMVEELIGALRSLVARGLAEEGLSWNQYQALYFLGTERRFRMRDVRDALGISGPLVTTIIDKTVGKGFATRQRSRDNRRNITVSLTPAGRSFLAKLEREKDRFYGRLLGGLRPAARRTMQEGLSIFVSRLRGLEHP
jgi:DNA-binding MarR family transcriptional regulator